VVDRTAKQALLSATGVRVEIPDRPPVALELGLGPGEAVQLAGPSGCGKSTLLRVLCRLEAAAAGALCLGGQPARQVSPQAWRRRVNLVPQRPAMLDGTVRDNLQAGFMFRASSSPPDDLEQQLRDHMQGLDLDPDRLLEQDARTLSGGEAARVALVRALLLQPEVLLCDEPTAALDRERAERLVGVLGAWVGSGGALVLVAHDDGPWDGLQRRVIRLGSEAAA